MSRSFPIPANIEMEVVRLIYAEGGEEARNLKDIERTQLYQSWTSDKRIGGRLLPFLGTDDNIRVWIKNGPMKELSRARSGVGKYKDLVANPTASVDLLVEKALGAGWTVNADSLQVKPLRVLIQREDDEADERWFAWGPGRDFKHLVWAEIKTRAGFDQHPWVLCLVDTFANRPRSEDEAFNQRIADRLGLIVRHVTDS
ncbi:hypothetical protein ACFWPX_17185 [Nocardia sp. NPDC058518]|uniref:hypothetical protein n=1 Tax=Nocardia sp. NPDC058518 TaxID=3346534 RepID=UPI0036473DD1